MTEGVRGVMVAAPAMAVLVTGAAAYALSQPVAEPVVEVESAAEIVYLDPDTDPAVQKLRRDVAEARDRVQRLSERLDRIAAAEESAHRRERRADARARGSVPGPGGPVAAGVAPSSGSPSAGPPASAPAPPTHSTTGASG